MQKAGKDKSRESRLNWRINLLRTLTHHAAALSPLAAQQQQQQAQANEWLFLNEKKKMESTCLMSFCFPFFLLGRTSVVVVPFAVYVASPIDSQQQTKKKRKKKGFLWYFPLSLFCLNISSWSSHPLGHAAGHLAGA